MADAIGICDQIPLFDSTYLHGDSPKFGKVLAIASVWATKHQLRAAILLSTD